MTIVIGIAAVFMTAVVLRLLAGPVDPDVLRRAAAELLGA